MLTNKPFLVCSVGKISLICWCLVSICTRTADSPLRNRDKLEVLNSPQASLLIPFLLQQLLKHWIYHCHSSLLFSAGLAGGTSSTWMPLPEAALAPLHWLSPLPSSSSSSSCCSSALRHHICTSQMTQVGSRSLWANQGVRCSWWFTIQQQSSSDGFFVARVWAEPGDLPWKVRRRWTCFPRSRNSLSEILCCRKTMTSSCHDLVCTKDLPHCKDQHFIAIGKCAKCAIMICVKVMYIYVKSAKWGNQRWNNFSLSLVFALCDSAGTPSVTLRRLH